MSMLTKGGGKNDLALILTDKEKSLSREWLTNKHINSAQHLLQRQFPPQNGL